MRNRLLTAIFLFLSLVAKAQNYPVYCTPILVPPYSLNMADYATGRLKVQLLLKDLTKPSVDVFVRIKLKGFGIEVSNPADYVPLHTVTLHPGIPVEVDLSENFGNLVYVGTAAGQTLAGGLYTWEATAYLADGRQVSNIGTALMSVFRVQPPLITYPTDGTVFDNTGFNNINFQWVNRSNIGSGLVFKLSIFEIPDEETDPNVVVQSGLLPVFTTQSVTTNYYYGPTDPQLIPGRRYAVQVQVQDLAGNDNYDNDGYSQVVSFRFGSSGVVNTCGTVTGLKFSAIDDQTAEADWDANPQAMDYLVQFRTAGGAWEQRYIESTGLTLPQLPPGSYDINVTPRCSYSQMGTASPTASLSLSTPAVITPDTVYTYEQPVYDPVSYTEPEPPVLDPLGFGMVSITVKDTTGAPKDYTPLPANPTTEQLKAALKSTKATCSGIIAGFTCGNHDDASQYSGTLIQPKAGDELAMNSVLMEVVELDANGNGTGIAHIKAFNNAKFGVEFKGIKVSEGGCIVAGTAETNNMDFAILSQTQRQNLAKAYTAYNATLSVVDAFAEEIAGAINDIDQLFQDINAKKSETAQILASGDVSKMVNVITNCSEIESKSKAAQDKIETLICLTKSGKINADLKTLEAKRDSNIVFMNKFGPAVVECANTGSFKPWEKREFQAPGCKGPCYDGESSPIDFNCPKLNQVLNVNAVLKKPIHEFLQLVKKIKAIRTFFADCTPTNFAPFGGGIVPQCFWHDIDIKKNDKFTIADNAMMAGIVDDLYIQADGVLNIDKPLKSIVSKGYKIFYLLFTNYVFGNCDAADIQSINDKWKVLEDKLTILEEDNDAATVWKEITRNQIGTVTDEIINCNDLDDIKSTISTVYDFVTQYDELKNTTQKLIKKCTTFFTDELGSKDLGNEDRYQQAKLITEAATLVTPFVVTKIKKVTLVEDLITNIENNSVKFEETLRKLLRGEVVQGAGKVFKTITTDVATALENRINHIRKIVFEAKSNGTYKFSGCHSKNAIDELGANARVEVTIPANAEGVYEAKVFAKGPDGIEIPKSGNQGKSTFFPDNWSEAKILEEAEHAVKNNKGFANGVDATEGYYGFSKDGKIKIQFYYRDSDGFIGSFFPKLD